MNSPRVGTINEGGQGEIIINENDDARGVLALSSLSVDVTEPNVGTFLQIIRTGGTFGTVRIFCIQRDIKTEMGKLAITTAWKHMNLSSRQTKI